MDDLVAVTMSRIRNDITLIKTSNFNRLGPCKEKSSFDLTPFSSHVQCIPRARLGGGVLPMLDNTGRLRPKGVYFFRQEVYKEGIS